MSILDPTSYTYEFLRFHGKNKDKTEVDFLIFMIDKFKTEIERYKNVNLDEYIAELDIRLERTSYMNETQKQKQRKIEIEKKTNHFKNLEYDCQRQIDFLNAKLNSFSSNSLKITENETFENDIDLSNSNAVQKIIYLNELGIIDLLRKEMCFGASVNNLANVITAITGEKHRTIQPYLNALLNNTGAENN